VQKYSVLIPGAHLGRKTNWSTKQVLFNCI